ncbi:hypothetical protein ACTXT7_008978 [Hymenolepis weldensis]
MVIDDTGSACSDQHQDRSANNQRVRTMGSAALHMCQIAAGQGDAFYEFGIHCWDYAAAWLIVTEAGGYCCNIDGGPVDLMARHCVAAASKELADKIIQKIVPISYPRD